MITLQVHYHVLKNSNKILLILKFKIKLWHGSVRETLLPANVQVHKVILPTKGKRTIVTRHTLSNGEFNHHKIFLIVHVLQGKTLFN